MPREGWITAPEGKAAARIYREAAAEAGAQPYCDVRFQLSVPGALSHCGLQRDSKPCHKEAERPAGLAGIRRARGKVEGRALAGKPAWILRGHLQGTSQAHPGSCLCIVCALGGGRQRDTEVRQTGSRVGLIHTQLPVTDLPCGTAEFRSSVHGLR